MNHRATSPAGKKSGFSLIELLVVIGILAILGGLLFPAVSIGIARSKNATCQNNLKQWAAGLSMYIDEHHGQLPKSGKSGGDTNAWFNVLPAYVGSTPMSTHIANGSVPLPGSGAAKSMFICPADRGSGSAGGYYNSYAYNDWIDGGDRGDQMGRFGKLLRNSQIRNARVFVVFVDSPSGTDKTVKLADIEGSFRHKGRANIAFLDGHVASLPAKEIFSETADNFGGIQWNPADDNLTGRGGN